MDKKTIIQSYLIKLIITALFIITIDQIIKQNIIRYFHTKIKLNNEYFYKKNLFNKKIKTYNQNINQNQHKKLVYLNKINTDKKNKYKRIKTSSKIFKKINLTKLKNILCFYKQNKYKKYIKYKYNPITITNFLNISYIWNYGIIFGIYNTIKTNQIIIISISIFFILYLLYITKALIQKNIKILINYGIIIGGAISNMIDRIKYGAVFDFIDFHIYNYHYYTFNIADIAITLGTIFILYKYIEYK